MTPTSTVDILIRMRRVFIAAMSTAIVLTLLTWRAAHTLYFSPGTHAILRQDSNTGAAIGFLVVLATAIGCLTALVLRENGKLHRAKLAWRISLGGFAAYTAAVIAVSLATPRMIVTGGDSYCYDLWCIAVQKVTATPAGQNTLYTIQVRLSSDANRVKTSAGNALPYLLDDQGHRFSLAQDPSVTPMDTTLSPGESVTTSVTFAASPKTHRLYLTRLSGNAVGAALLRKRHQSVPSTHSSARAVSRPPALVMKGEGNYTASNSLRLLGRIG